MKFPLPALMLVTDRATAGGNQALVRAVDEAVRPGGATVVQLRDKDLPQHERMELALQLRRVTAGRALLLVNASLDIAESAGADGVHLPEGVPMISRPPRPFFVGRSVHSVEAARQAWEECVDYIVAGPIYETGTHPGWRAAGIALLREMTKAVAAPVIAIGGITSERVPEVMEAGASGVAVVSAVLGAASPGEAAAGLRGALEDAWTGRRVVP